MKIKLPNYVPFSKRINNKTARNFNNDNSLTFKQRDDF